MTDQKFKNYLLTAQKNEITEHFIYLKLAKTIKDPHNQEVLEAIANDELKHYHYWEGLTEASVKPSQYKIKKYFLIAKILGLTFGIKLMENGEKQAQVNYERILQFLPDARFIKEDEEKHEKHLINLIDEERLIYMGSVVLGLNDALVELTGALAGYTLAFQNARLIAMAGLITGIAASFSMAASEYISTKTEETAKNPLKASVYTGIAYVLAVFLLILPFLVFGQPLVSLLITILIAILIIYLFNFYISVAKEISFKKRFLEMALISLGVAALSFGIGFLVSRIFNIQV